MKADYDFLREQREVALNDLVEIDEFPVDVVDDFGLRRLFLKENRPAISPKENWSITQTSESNCDYRARAYPSYRRVEAFKSKMPYQKLIRLIKIATRIRKLRKR